jgi:ankyrin repeat protein
MRKYLILLLFLMIGLLFVCNTAFGAFEGIRAKRYFMDEQLADLAAAAAAGRTAKMQKLLDQGVDINARGEGGMTVLCWALLRNSKPGFLFLLEHGANPNVEGDGPNLMGVPGFSVMTYAAMNEDIWWLQTVLQHGGNPNFVSSVERATPIFPAINAGLPVSPRIEHVRLLIKAGANLEARNYSGDTPALYAAYTHDYQVVYELLKAGADPKSRDEVGMTIASLIQRYPMVESGPIYEWREKVIAQLKAAGIDLGDRSKWATP